MLLSDNFFCLLFIATVIIVEHELSQSLVLGDGDLIKADFCWLSGKWARSLGEVRYLDCRCISLLVFFVVASQLSLTHGRWRLLKLAFWRLLLSVMVMRSKLKLALSPKDIHLLSFITIQEETIMKALHSLDCRIPSEEANKGTFLFTCNLYSLYFSELTKFLSESGLGRGGVSCRVHITEEQGCNVGVLWLLR